MFDHVAKSTHFHLFILINVAAKIFILYVYPTLIETACEIRYLICNLIPNILFSYN